ncbi:MAG: serine/threonine-protein kinase, partial [Acidobacteria bacterium]|nr:serine/threonine-protein kinase [Acidobacteriota bacterium]
MLTPGTSLGPYRIVSRLGTGGMGEVYRARDTRLDRDVAIKILPDSVALSPESSRRFEQEARAVALLSHPNLLAIHDVGRHEGRLYAVMELLEGQTLLERLEAGPIPLRKTLDWALQLAQGLAAAHDRGIVHRDLKPENVFITRDGHVKILDFGLARTLSGDRPSRLTGPGLVVGTMGYMSPEQLKGMEVDGRADIFSFGCVLYEMLAGREAFRRETDAETIAAVLKEDPPEIPAEGLGTPLVDRVLRRALEKEPDDRFRSAHDLAFALKAILDGSVSRSSATALSSAPEPRKRARLGNAIAAALALFAAGVLVGRLLPRPSPAGLPGMRLALPLPPGALSLAHDPGCIAISPDGKTFVYTATSGATSVLVRHALDGSGAAEIPGTEGGDGPFFSPDGRWVGFFRGGQLFKVALDGGKPFLIAKAPNARGAFWAKGDDIF